jgi:nucleoside-diphosphate-sugar epimerase
LGPVVLITGITGFVGGALAARLLESRRHSITALVRADSVGEARSRVAQSLTRFLGPASSESAAESVRVFLGDLAGDETYRDPDLDAITHVAHAAACTSFASGGEAWRTNVTGTQKLAVRMLAAPRLRRFLHVSTAYCCGDRPAKIVHEEDAPSAEHVHLNEYTRSKAAAELSLGSMDWRGRLVVARPSVIVGHSRLGVGPSSSLYWYYRAMAALGCGPFDLDDRRDVVPVDYVADALAFLLSNELPAFSTYHVSAGGQASACLGEIVDAIGSRCGGPGARGWRKVSAATLAGMEADLRPLVRNDDEAAQLARGLAACARFAELGVQWFDNSRLLAAGFRPPPSFLDYLDACVRSSGGATIFEQMVDDA